MNKKEMITKIAAEAGMKKVDVEKVITAVETSVIETLKNGGKVALVGFGTFSVIERKARKGRNPQTGDDIIIAARKSPKFTAGKNFKAEISK